MSDLKVFAIDTSVFVADRLHWTAPKYQRLLELAKMGHLHILIPDVVKNEVLKKIEEHSYKAERAWKEFKNEAYGILLTSENIAEIFNKDFDRENLVADLNESFEKFLKSKGVVVTGNNDISIDDILHLYFKQNPPFSGSEKKHEFPDAIALYSLKVWAKTKKIDHITLITHDQDWIKYAENAADFSVLGSIQKAIEQVLTVDIEAGILLENYKSLFIKSILEEFKENYGTYLDVDGGNVTSTYDEEIDFIELTIASSVDDDSIANVFATAVVRFNADIEYPDFGTASYDSEDKRYFFHNQIETTRETSVELDIEFDVGFDFINKRLEILSILINTDISSILIEAEPFDYY